jgi:serine phosphatase RsbU (regulator of sigma subunit)
MQESAVVTAVCAFVDLTYRTINYSTAGHPPMILAHADGSAEKLPYWGPPLGAAGGITYRRFRTKAAPGSTLFMYTDGLLEQNKDIERGEQHLIDAITMVQKDQAKNPAEALKQAILAEDAPRDDVAILTLSFERSYADEVVAKHRTA